MNRYLKKNSSLPHTIAEIFFQGLRKQLNDKKKRSMNIYLISTDFLNSNEWK